MQFFEELPPGRTARVEKVDWEKAKADLIANEGVWGLIAENISGSTTTQLRKGTYKSFRGDDLLHFEFQMRKPKNTTEDYGTRRSDLYGRYSSVATGGPEVEADA